MVQISLNLIYFCKGALYGSNNIGRFNSLLQQLSYTIDLEIAEFTWHIDNKNNEFFGWVLWVC